MTSKTMTLERDAARCVDPVLLVTRIAVHGARSAPRDTANQPRAFTGISRAPLAGSDLPRDVLHGASRGVNCPAHMCVGMRR